MQPRPHVPALLLVIATAIAGCKREPPPPPPPPIEVTPAAVGIDLCDAIEAAEYRELPREVAGNQFDPSGLVWVGDHLWLINDREGRKQVPPEGNGVVRLDPATGAVDHIAVPGFDDVSRKFEGLAWDGSELHAIGNVGNRQANTFLVSFPLDPASSLPAGEARYHDLACSLGAVTGLGCEPWGEGIKIEALAALGPGELAIGLRRTGDGRAARGYRVSLPPPPTSGGTMAMEPVAALTNLDLGTAQRGAWRMVRELGGLSEPVCEPRAILGVASAEYEQGDVWEFLSNAAFLWWPDAGTARLLCSFDDGLKVEGVAFAAGADDPCTGTLALLYDNDSKAPGGFKLLRGVALPRE